MVISSISKILCMSRVITIESFLICIFLWQNNFFLFSRCPISIHAKVENLILRFSNLLGHTFALNAIQTHSKNQSGPETIADERPRPNILLISGLD